VLAAGANAAQYPLTSVTVQYWDVTNSGNTRGTVTGAIIFTKTFICRR